MTATAMLPSTPLRDNGTTPPKSNRRASFRVDKEKQGGDDASLEQYEFRSLKLGNILGEGSCNHVYELTRLPSARRHSSALPRLNNCCHVDASSNNDIDKSALVVKTLKPKCVNQEDAVQDLVREGNILAELQGHKNIIRIHNRMGNNNDQKQPFIIMDRVKDNLSDRIQRWKRMSALSAKNNSRLQQQLKVAISLAKGLVWVHQNGIVHCDVKPDNVGFHHEDGTVKLLDFGSARYLHHSQVSIQGTIAYMAPEAIRLMDKRFVVVDKEVVMADEKVDVYSFGVLLWEMLSMHKPFVFYGYHSKLLMMDDGVEPVTRPDIWMDTKQWPEALCNLMKDCWSYKPWMRPTMQQVLGALEEISKDTNLNASTRNIC